MKVILYMAMTVNGLIAKSDDNTSWISKEEWDSYSHAVRTAGNLIVGRRTYHILTKQPEFAEFKDIKLIAVSHGDFETASPNHRVAHSPAEALKMFEGQTEVIVAGGGLLNASFLAENLVDEIYLDIEPIIFGEGIPLFHSVPFDTNLKFLDSKQISENEIQLHYQVLKSGL